MAKKFQANRFQMDPRQQAFLKAYLDPKSPTWSNATQSAISVGYSKEYADNITGEGTMPDWFANGLRNSVFVTKALTNLNAALDGLLDAEEGAKNIQWKATETTLRTLKKDDFTERTEVTGKDGGAIEVTDKTKGQEIAKEFEDKLKESL